MKRLRLTMVYDFSWAGEELSEVRADNLVRNFLSDPYGFLNLESPEWDETIYVDVEDITDGQ